MALAANVTGIVYYDANVDGRRVTTQTTTEGAEPGLAGVPVAAYGPDGTQLAATTSGSSGAYLLQVPDNIGQVRLEFGSLATLFSARNGEDSRTSVQFLGIRPSPSLNVASFGLHEPGAFCQANPLVAAVCIWAQDYGGDNQDKAAVRRFAYNERGAYSANAQGITNLATFGKVGAIFGMASKQGDTNSLWVSATLKRIAGYGPDGAGGIYRLDGKGTVVSWAKVPDAGDGDFPRPGNAGGNRGWDVDGAAFPYVGKRSLGGLDIVGDELNVVNLKTRSLVTYPASTAPPGAPLRTIAIPNPGCPGGENDWRPYGVGHFRGEVYVGGVCSGQMNNDHAQMQAVVLRLRDGGFSPVLRRGLNTKRGYPNMQSPNKHGWNPWTDDFNTTAFDATPGGGGGYVYPQPMLTSIQFDGVGSMILGFRDRWGDQMNSVGGPKPDGTGNVATRGVGGDINRACWNASTNGWDWEGTGVCPSNYKNSKYIYQSQEGAHQESPEGKADDEFFPDDYIRYPFGIAVTNPQWGHHETAEGGVVYRPALPSVMTTIYDPLTNEKAPTSTWNKQGVRWLRDDNGMTDYAGQDPLGNGAGLELQPDANSFGKANGMGDVEVLCEEAPLQIGNRVWFDKDRDGVQDPGPDEPPVPDVEVQLWLNGERIAATTTDDRGEYYFNDVKLGGALRPSTAYEVRIDMTQPALAAWRATTPNAAGVRDTIDSDGGPEATWSIARLTTGAAGQNDHSYDFGLYVVTTDTPTVEKTVSQSRATVGDRFFYTITVTNTTTSPIEGAVVVDPLPEIVEPLGIQTTRGSCTRAGTTYRCELGDLDPGATASIRIDVVAVSVGNASNVAVVRTPVERQAVKATVAVQRSRLTLTKEWRAARS